VVWHGAVADTYIVSAMLDGALALFLVSRDAGPDGNRLSDHGPPVGRGPATRRRARHAGHDERSRGPGAWARSRRCRAMRGGGRRHGTADRDHRRVPWHPQAVRQAAGIFPGAAAPRGRHAAAEGTGAVDGLRGRAGLDATDAAERRRKVSAAKVVTARPRASPASRRCSCTAAWA
jgi:hypothetical protein